MPAFRGEYAYLSNFYACYVELWGITFLNSEAAFQSAKYTEVRDRHRFAMMNPSEAKKLGKLVPLRADWNSVRVKVMEEVIHAKFEQNVALGQKLARTTHELVEENEWHDYFWGVCNGKGQNVLGHILMKEREVQRAKWGLTSH